MGFLDRFTGGSKVNVAVAAEPLEPAPGGEVTVRFDVSGELDDKCRGVRVGLEGTGSYLAEETTQNTSGGYQASDGTYQPPQTSYQTQEVWRSYELHLEEQTLPAVIGPGQAIFSLPADAPPSSSGVVSWQASARVDREGGKDKVQRVELAVRVPADGLPTARAPQQVDDGLTLDDVPVAVRAGDMLTGRLTVDVDKDVSVTAVHIRLHRKVVYAAGGIEHASALESDLLSSFAFSGTHITREFQPAEIDLTGKREFTAGSVEQIPFSIQVPADAAPTSAHPYARADWRVEAVLNRRMRDDLAVDMPLIVY